MPVIFNESHLRPYIPTPGNTLVDVGAYRGAWSIYLAPAYKHIHAIDPQPQFELLEPPPNVTLHRWAAGDEAGTLPLELHADRPHFVCPEKMMPEMVTSRLVAAASVESRPVDSLLPLLNAVTLLKIDVEGYEIEALMGSRQLIEKFHPRVIVECHSQGNQTACEDMLHELCYRLERVITPKHPLLSWLVGWRN